MRISGEGRRGEGTSRVNIARSRVQSFEFWVSGSRQSLGFRVVEFRSSVFRSLIFRDLGLLFRYLQSPMRCARRRSCARAGNVARRTF